MPSSGADALVHNRAQLERLTFFSDAVFAIAMTLLVIEVRLPGIAITDDGALADALFRLTPHYVGFVASFLVIGRFWVGHHELFGLLTRTSHSLVWANLLFLLAVAFMPFPTAILSEYLSLRVAIAVYAGWLVLLGLLRYRLSRVALAGRRLVAPEVEDAYLVYVRRTALVPCVLGAAAFAVGMIVPALALVPLIFGSPIAARLLRRSVARGAEPDRG